jgi:hypothetical protein
VGAQDSGFNHIEGWNCIEDVVKLRVSLSCCTVFDQPEWRSTLALALVAERIDVVVEEVGDGKGITTLLPVASSAVTFPAEACE